MYAFGSIIKISIKISKNKSLTLFFFKVKANLDFYLKILA